MKKKKNESPITLGIEDLIYTPENKPEDRLNKKSDEEYDKSDELIETLDLDENPDGGTDSVDIEETENNTESKESINVDSEWIEKSNPEPPEKEDKARKISIRIILGLLTLLVIAIGCFIMQLTQDKSSPVVWNTSVVEYGTKDFNPIKKLNNRKLVSIDKLDTDVVGTYTIEAKIKDEEGKVSTVSKEFTVKDTQKPKITTEKDELTIKLGETPDYNLLKIKATDPVDGEVSYIIQDGGLSTIGDHKVLIKATDYNGNSTTKKITIHVTGYVTNTALDAYRTYATKLKTAYEEAQKAKEEAEKAAQSQKNSSGRIIWVGDSRFVGMSQVCNSDTDVYVAKGSMGYSWFASSAISQVNSQLQAGDTIVVNIGVNGLECEKLASKLNELASGDWKDYKVIYMSVNPVDEEKEAQNGYSTTNEQIKEFNTYMKQHLGTNITYLDTYSSLVNDISSRTSDGLHYATSTSNAIYNMARASISQ